MTGLGLPFLAIDFGQESLTVGHMECPGYRPTEFSFTDSLIPGEAPLAYVLPASHTVPLLRSIIIILLSVELLFDICLCHWIVSFLWQGSATVCVSHV